MKNDPKKDVNATVDFLMTVFKGHILAEACRALGVKKLDSEDALPPHIREKDRTEQYKFLLSIATDIVNKCTLIGEALSRNEIIESSDGIYNYAKTICHYGALVMEFRDSWAEGDGERAYRCWRLFLPHFLMAKCHKYALEALRLQAQVKALLSPHLAHHILWDRYINTRGGIGRNIPCDLHNEHVNKLIKHIIANMGANLTEEALTRAARSVSTLESFCHQYDKCSGVPFFTHTHSTRSDAADVMKVMCTVQDQQLLRVVPGRKHYAFPNIPTNPLKTWDITKTQQWIEQKKKDFIKYTGALGAHNTSTTEESDFDN